ncbi:MAG: hypothetical protein RL065_1091 [Bacteroidota bacterium]
MIFYLFLTSFFKAISKLLNMKVKLLVLTIFAIVVGILINNERIVSNSSAPPSNSTGSLGSGGATCNSCHSGTSGGSISYTIYKAGTTNVASKYEADSSYDITITVNGSGNLTPKFGFELTVEDNTGNPIGLISANSLTNLTNTNIGLNSASHSIANALINTWYFKWQAPSSSTYSGIVHFDMVGAYANGDLTNSGDSISTNSFTLLSCSPSSSSISGTTCSNQSYNFNGILLTSSGVYNDTLVNSTGCDSIITLTLNTINISSSIINDSICGGQSYSFNGNIITTSGTYYDTLTNYNSCDSLVILNLVVKQQSSHTIHQTLCCGNTILFNNQTILSPGIYLDTLTNAQGCDSTVVLIVSAPSLNINAGQNYSLCATLTNAIPQQNFFVFDSIKTFYGVGNPNNYLVKAILFSNSPSYLPASSSPDTSIAITLSAYNASVAGHNPSNVFLNKYMAPYWGGNYTLIIQVKDSMNNYAYDTLLVGIQHNKYCRNVAINDVRIVAVNQPVLIDVQANDNHVSSSNSQLTFVSSPLHGTNTTIVGASGKKYAHYKPNQSYAGKDSFYYTEIDSNAHKLGSIINLLPDTAKVKVVMDANLTSPAGANATICLGVSVTLGTLNCSTMFPEGIPSNTPGYFSDSVKWYEDTIGKAINPLSNPIYSNCGATLTVTPQYNISSSYNYIAQYNNGMLDTIFCYINGCPIIVDAGVDKLTCLGSGVNIGGAPTVVGGVPTFHYQWTPNTYMQPGQDTMPNPLVVPTAVGSVTYAVVVTDGQSQISTDTMILSVFSNPSYKTLNDTICSNSTYSFNNQTLNIAGTYLDTLANYVSCDSFITLNLVIKPISSHSYIQTICSSDSISFNGKTIKTPGIYLDTLTAFNGCDSFVTLTLQVILSSSSVQNQTICSNSSFAFNGNNLNISGTYYDTLSNILGCDSVVILNLLVHSTDSVFLPVTICSNQTYFFKGNFLNTSGIYKDTLNNQNGCDSLTVLALTVNPTSASSYLQTVCSNVGYIFGGNNLTSSGTYFDTLSNYLNCDSVVTLSLTVLNSPITNLSQTVCFGDSVSFKNVYIHTSGVYQDTLTSYNGCDSLVNFTLNVLPILSTTYNQNVCFGNSYLFNGNALTTNGTYLDTLQGYLGCDSFITMNLFVQSASTSTINQTICVNNPYSFNSQNLTIGGVYYDTLVNYVGCDSFITLNLIVNPISNLIINQTICSNTSYTFNGSMLNVTGVYYDTLQNQFGCDSFITLNLNVNQIGTSSFSQTICVGNSVTFNGNNLTTTGQYFDTLVAFNGCDSIITFNLTVNPTSSYNYNYNLCVGSTYLFNGNNLSTGGLYYDTLTNYLGCDSFIVLNLNIVNPSSTVLNQSTCINNPFVFNSQSLIVSGTYYDTLVNQFGCDSLITLNLTVNSTSSYSMNQTICSNNSYLFNSQSLTASGTYYDTLINYVGCDSLITLNLSVLPTSTNSFTQTICNGTTYLFNGINRSVGGLYHDTLQNYLGCDSFIDLTLIVLPNATNSILQTICAGQSYNFFGNNITATGTYNHKIIGGSYNGCDSTIILNVSTLPATYSNSTITTCSNNPVTFNGHLLTSSGVYYDTLVNHFACDSFIQLNLTVVPQQVTHLYQSICAGASFSFFSNTYTTSGIYRDSIPSTTGGCAQIYILHLTVQPQHVLNVTKTVCANSFYIGGQTFTASGFYQITIPLVSGCDSLINLTLTLNPINTNITVSGNTLTAFSVGTITWFDCKKDSIITTGTTFTPTVSGNYAAIITNGLCSDTTSCYFIYITPPSGIDNSVANNQWIKLYPNPASQEDVTLSIDCSTCKEIKFELMDMSGRILRTEDLTNKKLFTIKRETIASGIYFVRLTNENGKQSMKKLVWE